MDMRCFLLAFTGKNTIVFNYSELKLILRRIFLGYFQRG